MFSIQLKRSTRFGGERYLPGCLISLQLLKLKTTGLTFSAQDLVTLHQLGYTVRVII